MEVSYAPTPYGFTYGPATVMRLCHDKTGAVEIGIDSQKAQSADASGKTAMMDAHSQATETLPACPVSWTETTTT